MALELKYASDATVLLTDLVDSLGRPSSPAGVRGTGADAIAAAGGPHQGRAGPPSRGRHGGALVHNSIEG